MDSIVIKEDQISRKWLSGTILKSGLDLIRKWWIFSAGAIAIVVILLYFLGIPKRAWFLFLFFPVFPLIIGMSLIMTYPLYSMPQNWIINHNEIQARGFRLFGKVFWRNIYEWRIESILSLNHYYRFHFKWKKWKGIASGQHSILVPSSVPVKEVEACFNKYCKR